MMERLQLNLRLDGRDDLLEAVKAVAASQGLSVNAFIVKALEGAVGIESTATGKKKQPTTPAKAKPLISKVLDKPLDKPGEMSSTKPLDNKILDTELQNELCNLRTENESLRQELAAANKQLAEWDKELDQLHARNGDLGLQVQMLQSELVAIRTDRPEIQESVPAVADFPEPSDLLNQLRTRRKKSRADLADMEVVLEILETDRSEI